MNFFHATTRRFDTNRPRASTWRFSVRIRTHARAWQTVVNRLMIIHCHYTSAVATGVAYKQYYTVYGVTDAPTNGFCYYCFVALPTDRPTGSVSSAAPRRRRPAGRVQHALASADARGPLVVRALCDYGSARPISVINRRRRNTFDAKKFAISFTKYVLVIIMMYTLRLRYCLAAVHLYGVTRCGIIGRYAVRPHVTT